MGPLEATSRSCAVQGQTFLTSGVSRRYVHTIPLAVTDPIKRPPITVPPNPIYDIGVPLDRSNPIKSATPAKPVDKAKKPGIEQMTSE